ncbi:MAG: class I tRNA ligase family protein [Bacteroidia bacterium]
MEYNFREIEDKWQQYWREHKTYKVETDKSKPKYYVLDMFPYPSGAGLHVGHPLGYIASDIYSRYKRLRGFNVLHPMGYDSFGLPAEQYAIQTGQHPAITTEQNIARYREQLDRMGFSFDWDREVRTSDPKFYKWTQWIFIQLFHSWYNNKSNKAERIETLIAEFERAGNANVDACCAETKTFTADEWKNFSEKEQQEILMNYRFAFLSETMVNWCPQLGSVLANDEVKDGVSERGGYPVERKLMQQWSLRITAYSQRLLDDLDTIDWSDSLKESQRNWIGRSEGTSLKFEIRNLKFGVEVFTTRPDTIFGATYLTLAPEHELLSQITTPENKKAVDEYVTWASNRSERDRQSDVKKITGVFTGAYAEHPFTKEPMPIWVGDYVLAGYGTGAVMAVPAHDTRDYAFAKHFSLPIVKVIEPPVEWDFEKESYDEKSGKCISSDFLNGLEVKDAIKHAIEEIEKQNIGKGKINFRQRDAIFGRQRYWGEPIPIYYKDNIAYTLPESELPLVLPEVDKYLPTETGEPPLARAKDFNYKGYPLETTTMPGWAGSSWYYLRYMDAHNESAFASKEAIDYWGQVDLYLGGSEHATGHLLYVRFWTKFLKDLGYINIDEPAKKLINQGMMQGTSAIVYRVERTHHVGGKDRENETSLTSTNLMYSLPQVFVSKGYVDKITKTKDGNLTWHDDTEVNNLQNKLHEIASSIYSEFSGKMELTPYVTPLHVDVNIVDNNVLDIEAFKQWREEFADAEFILEDDKYICGSEIEKMSKRWYNVVNPDDMCDKYGTDCFRMYEMFLGPLEQSKPWNTNGITGVSGFLKKLWRLYENAKSKDFSGEASKEELKVMHKTIKKITEDIERFSFNTSVSSFMICVNELTDLKCTSRDVLQPLAVLLSPYAPHIAEELWAMLGNAPSVTKAEWPVYDEQYLVEDAYEYPVSINGKKRFTISLSLNLKNDEIENEVLAANKMKELLNGAAPKKVIVIPGKIVNVVV